MPKGTKVEEIYNAILNKTGDKGLAAATAQKRTGASLKTGRKSKKRGKSKKSS